MWGQLARLMALTAAGLALAPFVRWPSWRLPLIVLDSPLTLAVTGVWAVAGVLGLLVGVGTDVLLRLDAERATAPWGETLPCWILPGLMAAVAALLTVRLTPWTAAWGLALLGSALGIGGVGWMLLDCLEGAHPRSTWADFALTMVSYALALVAFTAVYAARVRTALSGSAVGIVAALLAVWLFSAAASLNRRTVFLGTAVGLALLVITWGLNHHPLPVVAGGVTLLLSFYVVTSLGRAYLLHQLTRRVGMELTVVVAAVLLLLIAFAPKR